MAQKAQAAAEDTAALLPVDNSDVANHVVEGKGTGLEAAAGAAAEQEEAIKAAKSSGLTLSPFTECITASRGDTIHYMQELRKCLSLSAVSLISIHSHV